MTQFKYLIIGGGMTADAAAKGIRSLDSGGTIGMIGSEPDPPYDRPPLSKGLWKGKPLAGIWRNTEAKGVDWIGGRKAVSLDPVKQEVMDDHGAAYRYESLLLATGGRPKRHPSDGSAIYYRTFSDYKTLRDLADRKQRFVVIGGGFIGSEMAAALTMNGKSVDMAFFASGICGHILPPYLAGLLNRRFEEKGVRLFPGRGAMNMAPTSEGVEVCLEDGTRLVADAAIAGLGLAPNVELAIQAGLSVGNGIVVDERLRTSHANIYAAGDVANFPCPALNRRARFEHEDNANAMGALAGRNMAGATEVYGYLPYFYSDLFEIGYEAIGETDPSYQTVVEWVEPDEKGVVFYVKEDRVRGVLFWNIFGKLDAARDLMAMPGPVRSADLGAWAKERLSARSEAASEPATPAVNAPPLRRDDPGLNSLLRLP